ncbi:MAG: 3D domain-containing protein [Pyrinomonadaceae bacterium]
MAAPVTKESETAATGPRKIDTHKPAPPQPEAGKDTAATPEASVTPPQSFIATAYCLRGRTASGRYVAKGVIAADRRILPLGTRVRIQAGRYSGEYLVADTGGAIRGRKIDIWMPSGSEAMRFGRRSIKLTVLSYGRRAPAARARRPRRQIA